MPGEIVACPHCGRKNRIPAAALGKPRCGQCATPLPLIATADDATFAEVVDRSSTPVLLDLWAPWCGPCRAVSPALETLARERAGQLKLVKIDVDQSPGTATRFDVRSIPTLLVLDRGVPRARQVGAASEGALRAWLDAALLDGQRHQDGTTSAP